MMTFIIDVLNILPVSLSFIQESFQVLESDVHGIRENTSWKIEPVSTVLVSCTGYQTQSPGWKGRVVNQNNSKNFKTVYTFFGGGGSS